MSFIWLIVWLLSGTPHLEHWNAWVVGIIVCGAIDVLGILENSRD